MAVAANFPSSSSTPEGVSSAFPAAQANVRRQSTSSTAASSKPAHRTVVPAGDDPALVYKNAVTTPEELPASQQPRYFTLVKGALLLFSFLCLVAGVASIAFGAYVEAHKGLIYPGARDIPFKVSTAAIFLGGFTASVAAALLAIVYRNWHPSLLTFGLFVGWIAFAALAVNGMMQPRSAMQYERVLSWARMPSANHKMFFDQYQCCGYDNVSTCNLTAIGKVPGVQLVQLHSSSRVETSQETQGALRRRQVEPDAGTAEPDATGAATDAGADTVAPAAASEPAVPQNGPGVPLPTDVATSFAPVPLPTADQPAPFPTDDVKPCQPYVDPVIDAELLRFSKYYIVAAVCSVLQLGFLAGFWALLGRWKRARGVGRW